MGREYIQKKPDRTYNPSTFLISSKKIGYLIPFLILGLIFCFSFVTNGCGLIEEQEKEDEYLSKVVYIMRALADDSNFYSELSSDLSSGNISLAEHKEVTKKLIGEINDFYSQYLELTPPSRLKTSHDLLGKSMEHYLSGCNYLQKYIDSEGVVEMEEYFGKATLEWNKGSSHWLEARDELQKFLEAEGQRYQKFIDFFE